MYSLGAVVGRHGWSGLGTRVWNAEVHRWGEYEGSVHNFDEFW